MPAKAAPAAGVPLEPALRIAGQPMISIDQQTRHAAI
jgi:hypothetical protein